MLTACLLSALLGTLTVYLVYRVGQTAYGRSVGLLAAFLTAIAPLCMREAHFTSVDTTQLTLLMVGLLFMVRLQQTGLLRDYLLAGVSVGLAASTKNGGVLAVIPLAIAHFSVTRPKSLQDLWDRRLFLALATSAIAFFATSPYLILDSGQFWEAFSDQVEHVYERGHTGETKSGWIYHLTHTMRYGFGFLPSAAAAAGILISACRRENVDLAFCPRYLSTMP